LSGGGARLRHADQLRVSGLPGSDQTQERDPPAQFVAHETEFVPASDDPDVFALGKLASNLQL